MVLIFWLLLPSLPARANPALWVIHGPHATVYLFGSVHLLRPGTEWEGPGLHRAFDAASECWFEVEPPEDPDKLWLLTLHSGFDSSHKLSDFLTPEEHLKLVTVAEDVGLHQMRLTTMRPWLVAELLERQLLVRSGYDPALGVDAVLQERAKATGKAILGIEQEESHVHLSADLPQDLAIQMLTNVVDEAAYEPAQTDKLIADWQAGDTASLTERLTREPGELYDVVMTRRNILFADIIEDLSMGSKTSLVTVGAGHFAGSGNVRELLEARGIQVERVPN